MKRAFGRLSSFSRTVFKSVSDVKFYRGIRHKPLKETIAYLSLLIAFFWMVPYLVVFFVGVREGIDAFNRNLRTYVPAGARFEMKKGRFSDSLRSPIVIRGEGTVFILNTATTTLTLRDKEYGMAIGAAGIVERKDDGTLDTIGYSTVPDFQTTKEGIDDWISAYAPWVVLLLAVFSFAAIYLMVSAGYAVVILAYGFLLWAALKLFKRPRSYRESFIVAAYAATGMIILKSALFWSGFDSGLIPSALYWILLAFIVYDAIKGEVSHEPT